MNNNIKKGIMIATFLLFFVSINFVFAKTDNGLIGCNGPDCGWENFFGAISRIMKYVYVTAFSISTILFAYAGVLLMTSQGDVGKVTQAKDIFKNVIIGISIMFLAYWAIWMLLKGLGVDQSFYQLLKG